jgi:hypothetical protein
LRKRRIVRDIFRASIREPSLAAHISDAWANREANAMPRKLLIFAAIGAALCSAAAAQQAASPTDAIPEKVAPGAVPNTDLSKQGGSLSDKLSNSNGVIHPEGAVDPKMQKPAPATGATPVIPPPVAPGVQPK